MANGYDREYVKNRTGRARVRLGLDTDSGTVTRFVLQLEYRMADEWTEVVRFDHDTTSSGVHDVSKDGVHMDVYRDGRKYRREEIFPRMNADDALNFAEAHLAEHAERYIKRFEIWHGIRTR